MDERNLALVIYRWVATRDNAHLCSNSCSVCFCNEDYHAVINFYPNNLVELSVEDRCSKETVFYLHFEIRDLKSSTEKIESFFKFLKHPPKKEQLNVDLIENKQINILLSCTSGLTTSYFAYLMQEKMNKVHQNIKIDAVSFTKVDEVENQYDYILLAPQISYKYDEFKEKYGDKVMMMDTIDFASLNVDSVLNQIILN